MGDRLIATILDSIFLGAVFAVIGMYIAARMGGVTDSGFSLNGTPAALAMGATLLVSKWFSFHSRSPFAKLTRMRIQKERFELIKKQKYHLMNYVRCLGAGFVDNCFAIGDSNLFESVLSEVQSAVDGFNKWKVLLAYMNQQSLVELPRIIRSCRCQPNHCLCILESNGCSS